MPHAKQNPWQLLLLLTMTLPVSALAQVYKWTDQNGKTQYGDQPPSGKGESELLRVNQNQEPRPLSSDWQERERGFQKRRVEKQMQAEKEMPSVSAQQICQSARYKLQLLDGKVVYRVNDKGERVYMEDAERNAVEANARKDIERYCSR